MGSLCAFFGSAPRGARLALAAVVCVGCNHDVTVDNFLPQIMVAIHENRVKCGAEDPVYADAFAAAPAAYWDLDHETFHLKSAIADGRLTFDAKAAAGCIEYIRSGTDCSGPTHSGLLDFCPGITVMQGQAEIGDSCAGPSGMGGVFKSECRAHLYCNHLCKCEALHVEGEDVGDGQCDDGLRAVAGKCVGLAGLGEACVTSDDCEANLVCFQSVCSDVAISGGACDLTDENCAVGLDCVAGSCQPLPAEGEHCSGNCLIGDWCDAQTCMRTLMQKDGEPCGDGCGLGLFCSVGGVCTRWLAAGADCAWAGTRCDYGLFCDPTLLKCAPVKSQGESCRRTDECSADFGCNPWGVCAEPAAWDDNDCFPR